MSQVQLVKARPSVFSNIIHMANPVFVAVAVLVLVICWLKTMCKNSWQSFRDVPAFLERSPVFSTLIRT